MLQQYFPLDYFYPRQAVEKLYDSSITLDLVQFIYLFIYLVWLLCFCKLKCLESPGAEKFTCACVCWCYLDPDNALLSYLL